MGKAVGSTVQLRSFGNPEQVTPELFGLALMTDMGEPLPVHWPWSVKVTGPASAAPPSLVTVTVQITLPPAALGAQVLRMETWPVVPGGGVVWQFGSGIISVADALSSPELVF